MKFRTEIDIAPCSAKIGYQNRILALGSCFTEHIAGRLAKMKFRATVNPSGILFNPLSIASALWSYAQEEQIQKSELGFDGEVWFHYDFHGSFSVSTPEEALGAMNAALELGAVSLKEADCVFLTFGTAWVFEHQGKVVANCHRQPASEFIRRRLTVDEIVDALSDLIEGPLQHKEIFLTVSPVRHLGDGLEGNGVSKATLRLAVEELTTKYTNVHYFPAYEILMDDLRDYRFYADDLVHPAQQAIEYVWEKFVEVVLSPEARQLLPAVEQIVTAAAHRPRNPQSDAYLKFCRDNLAQIAALPQLDFRDETTYFSRCLEINS